MSVQEEVAVLESLLLKAFEQNPDYEMALSFASSFYCIWNAQVVKKALLSLVSTRKHEFHQNPTLQLSLENTLHAWIHLYGISHQTKLNQPQLPPKEQVTLGFLANCVLTSSECLEAFQANKLKLLLLRNCKLLATKANYAGFLIPIGIKSVATSSVSPLATVSVPAQEVAQALCKISESILRNISFKEFAGCKWMKANGAQVAPSIMKAIGFYNYISALVATDIVLPQTDVLRAMNIARIIEIASWAKKLHNYDVVSAIIAGLNSCPSTRLKNSWRALPKKNMGEFDELEEFVTPISNYSAYRAHSASLITAGIIFVPILSVILRDVAGVDASNPNINEDTNLPNFHKVLMMGKALHPLLRLQASPQTDRVEFKSRDRTSRDRTRSKTGVAFPISQILGMLSHSAPIEENTLLGLSYVREPPANQALLDDYTANPCLYDSNVPDNVEQTTQQEALSDKLLTKQDIENTSTITRILTIRGTSCKDPATWNRFEIFCKIEAWGIPADLVLNLVNTVIPNGQALLQDNLDLRGAIPVIGYRKSIQRNIAIVKQQQSQLLNFGQYSSVVKFDDVVPASLGVQNWVVDDVVEWLNSIPELAQYSTLFAQNSICGQKLMSLSQSDLQTLGVQILGHRKSILRKIAELGNQSPALSRSNQTNQVPLQRSAAVHDGSRRSSLHPIRDSNSGSNKTATF